MHPLLSFSLSMDNGVLGYCWGLCCPSPALQDATDVFHRKHTGIFLCLSLLLKKSKQLNTAQLAFSLWKCQANNTLSGEKNRDSWQMHRICIIAVCYLFVFVAVYVLLGEVCDQRFTFCSSIKGWATLLYIMMYKTRCDSRHPPWLMILNSKSQAVHNRKKKRNLQSFNTTLCLNICRVNPQEIAASFCSAWEVLWECGGNNQCMSLLISLSWL